MLFFFQRAGNVFFTLSSAYLYAVSDIEVIVRLHEFGLFPEAKRLEVVSTIRGLAVDIPDAGFLREKYRNLFSEEEFDDVLSHILTNLLPKLGEHIGCWVSGFDGESDPEDYFYDLKNTLNDYKMEFFENSLATAQINSALDEIDQEVYYLRAEMPEEPNMDEHHSSGPSSVEAGLDRSIFDDVDH